MTLLGSVPGWRGAVDFTVLALGLYIVLCWARQAQALRVVVALLALGIGSLTARQAGLVVTATVLNAVSLLAAVAVVITFQADFRRALRRVDLIRRFFAGPAGVPAATVRAVSEAAFSLAQARRGGLIVIARRDSLGGIVHGGVPLGGEISTEILEAIFRKVSPVHDGAVIVEGDRISRVSAILPLSDRDGLLAWRGTRHRAALGVVERSDAVAVVISEEHGTVTLMVEGEVAAVPDREMLAMRLQGLWEANSGTPKGFSLRRSVLGNVGLKAAAVAMAAVVWAIVFLPGPDVVRIVSVPVEFRHVPGTLEIREQSTHSIEAQVRASAWLFDVVALDKVVARIDLAQVREGQNVVHIDRGALSLPPGLTVERIWPDRLRVQVSRPRPP